MLSSSMSEYDGSLVSNVSDVSDVSLVSNVSDVSLVFAALHTLF